jgi:hypothetical protein
MIEAGAAKFKTAAQMSHFRGRRFACLPLVRIRSFFRTIGNYVASDLAKPDAKARAFKGER